MPVHAKLAAWLCLIMQVWGGTGLDQLRFCTQDPAPSPSRVESAPCECCCSNAPADEPDTTAQSAECCLQAPLPDDGVVPSRDRDDDLQRVFSLASFPAGVSDPVIHNAVIACFSPRTSPPTPHSLACTRLRL